MIETTILLTPQEEWPDGKQIEDIVQELDAMVQFPGVTNAWTMPIKTRIDMLATGIKTPVGVKLLGDDLETLSRVGIEIEGVLSTLPGTASVYSERVVGGNYVDIRIRRADAARYGLNVADVQGVVQFAPSQFQLPWATPCHSRRSPTSAFRRVRPRSRARTHGAPPGSSSISIPVTSAATYSARAAWSNRR
jgi:multidrug efflux pump subunit AcrB